MEEGLFVCALKASWLNSTANLHTTIAAAVWNGRLCGGNLKGVLLPSIQTRQSRRRVHV